MDPAPPADAREKGMHADDFAMEGLSIFLF
jgi:hypothetical protein